MKTNYIYLFIAGVIFFTSGCKNIEAFLQKKLFNFKDDIHEIDQQITNGEEVFIEKSNLYVLKMSERGEIRLQVDGKNLYADLPYKKYVPIKGQPSDPDFINEETYLYLDDFVDKKREKLQKFHLPIAAIQDSILVQMETLFELVTEEVDASIYRFFKEKVEELTALRVMDFQTEPVFEKLVVIIEKLEEKVPEIEAKKAETELLRRANGGEAQDHFLITAELSEKIDNIQWKLQSLKEELNKVKSEIKKVELKGTAAYLVTYPYTDSINMKNMFNATENGNNLVLNSVRHIRLGFWEWQGDTRKITLFFKHGKKLTCFKGIENGSSDAVILTQGSHPSMQKHFKSRTLHYMDISDVLELDGLPFRRIDQERRIIGDFDSYEEYEELAVKPNPPSCSDNNWNSKVKYPSISGFRFFEVKKGDKEIPKIYFFDTETGCSENGTFRPRYFRYDGDISILDEKEYSEIKAANP